MSSREPSSDGRKRPGEYQVIKNIGEGSFGQVKLAIHTLTGQKVALKYFSKARIKNMKLGARVNREIQYLRLLDHPHIVKIYEVIDTSTDIIMVIEFAGAELFDTLAKHGRLPEETARSIFQQLVSAVAHSHKFKVIHRDLKPENSDSFARPLNGELVRVYAGPEVDVWSIGSCIGYISIKTNWADTKGVILYLMLAGRLPFEDENTHALMDKICTGKYHIPSDIPPDAANLIKNCIVVNPIKRLTMSDIMQHPWFLAGLPKYLRIAPQTPNLTMPVESLSYILAPQKEARAVPESSWPIPELVDELVEAIGGSKEEVLESLGAEGDNAIKVAYNIARDKRERTNAHPRRGLRCGRDDRHDVEPYGTLFSRHMHIGSSSAELYRCPTRINVPTTKRIVQLMILTKNGNLTGMEKNPDAHHLASYAEAHATAQSQEQMRIARGANPTTEIRKRTKCTLYPCAELFVPGAQLYNTLKSLGWEWREKPNLVKKKTPATGEEVDPREDSDIYFLETRCRINDVVVDAINYLVDFRNVGYYQVVRDQVNESPFTGIDDSQVNGGKIGGEGRKLDDITSPFLFLESACRLIQQLAGA
ncbi:snf 1 [Rhizoctonia solani AG-1 IA]|uniref:non-specific serine/threonine protein kinase n=1 Tax=Thanatephorus cucumeris (strain AG1-IA) TaxID=983506 RepID=L8X3X7_THACA|nr:snf 1 [Rhizoctonia solani AG-1 IA]